jgi:hypothetical protein
VYIPIRSGCDDVAARLGHDSDCGYAASEGVILVNANACFCAWT